jgi:hypothetical protein
MQNLGQTPDGVMSPAKEESGRARDIIGAKVGLSGKSYDRAKKAINRISQEEDEGLKFFFGDVLDENIVAANKLADKPTEFILSVMEKTDNIKKVGSVIRELEHEEIKKKFNLPTGKFQVIYVDITVMMDNEIMELPISDHAEQDSVLLIWVLPQGLERGLGLINSWGFKYKTCMLWNKDFCDEVSVEGEIMLISTKGNPPKLVESPDITDKTKKPPKIQDLIRDIYKNDIFEIQLDGWQIWGNEF